MKHLQVIAALLAPLLVISSALSQTGNREVHDQATNHAEIATARSRYVQADLQTEDVAGRPSGGEAYAQSRRPGPRPPMRPRLGYPQRTYPPRWGSGYPRHAAIGALVGFGLGAAFGAKANTDRHPGVGTRAALLFGTFGAMIGAVVGNGIGPVHSRKVYRRWPAEEDELGSHPKAGRTEQTASARPSDSAPPAGAQDPTQTVSEAP